MEIQTSSWLVINRIENSMPAMAAAFGVLSLLRMAFSRFTWNTVLVVYGLLLANTPADIGINNTAAVVSTTVLL